MPQASAIQLSILLTYSLLQAVEFFAFAALMFLDIIVLGVLAYFFKYREEEPEAAADEKPVNEKSALEMPQVRSNAAPLGAAGSQKERDEQM